MKYPMPLRHYLSLHFGLAAIIPVMVIAVLVYLFIVPDTQERTTVQHQIVADSISGQVSAYLEGGARQIKALAAQLENRGIQPGPELTAMLDAQCGNGEYFETLFIFNNADAAIQAVGLPELRRPNRQDLIGLDLFGRTFIKEIKETRQTFLSKTFLSMVSNRMAVALAAPLPNGFLIGEITLDKFSDFIRRLPAKSGFVTMVIDGEGLVLADPMKRHWGHTIDFNFTAAGKKDLKKDNAIRAFELDGEKMMGTLVKMDQIGWQVLVAQPARKVFEPLGKIFSLLGWGMAASLGLVLALSWLVAGKFAALFASYVNNAESIARGDYKLELSHTKTRESVRMDKSLARMAEKISQREEALRFTQFSFDKAAVGIHYIHSDGSILKVNKHAARMLGYTAEEMAQLSVFDINPDADTKSFNSRWRKLVEDGSGVRETYHLRKDGSRIPVEIVANCLEYEGRQFAVCFVQDISERRQMEESLRLTQFIFDRAPIGIWRIGENGEILDVNKQGCDSLGYSLEELCCMKIFDLDVNFQAEDWPETVASLKAVGTGTIETSQRRKSGEVFPIQVIANIVQFENQEFHVAFVQDITERKRMEESLRLTQFIFDKAPIGIWRMGKDGGILDVNEQGCAGIGYTKEELCRMKVFDFDPNFDKDAWEDNVALVKTAGICSNESLHRRKNGEIYPIHVIEKMVQFEDQEYHVAFVEDITQRKQAEKALRENKQLLSNVLESMDEAVAVFDENFTYQLVNKKHDEFTEPAGKTRQDIIGKTLLEAFPEFKESATEKMIKKAMKGEIISGIESLHIHGEKSFWVKESYCPLKDKDGGIFGVVGVGRDITRQKQNEEKLQEKDQLLLDIGKLVKIGAWKYDLETGKATSTDEVSRINDLEPGRDLNVEKGLDFYRGVHREKIEHAFNELVEQGTPYDLELEIVSAKGIPKWVRATGYPVMRDGRVVQVQGAYQDITERKRMEEALRENYIQLKTIYNTLPVTIWSLDKNGVFTMSEGKELGKLGFKPGQVVGASLFDLYKDDPIIVEYAKRALEGESCEYVSSVMGNYYHTLHMPFFNDNKQLQGVVGLSINVTEKRKMEEMMIQSEKMLSVGGLAAGMAHEINNPMAGMLQTAQVLAQRLKTGANIPANLRAAEAAGTTMASIEQFMEGRGIPRMIEAITESGERISKIVTNMLSFARKDDTAVSSHHLDKILDKTIELAATDYDLKKEYDFKQVKIVKEYGENLPAVPCRASKIQQVLLNILTNGAQAMQGAGTPNAGFIIRTYVDSVRNMACIEIQDNGPGMDEKTRKKIFDPFFTTKPEGVGTGLGLSVSYFIITQNHKGKMTVESSPGAGAKFIIRLPL